MIAEITVFNFPIHMVLWFSIFCLALAVTCILRSWVENWRNKDDK